jgi:hypothetical protein
MNDRYLIEYTLKYFVELNDDVPLSSADIEVLEKAIRASHDGSFSLGGDREAVQALLLRLVDSKNELTHRPSGAAIDFTEIQWTARWIIDQKRGIW